MMLLLKLKILDGHLENFLDDLLMEKLQKTYLRNFKELVLDKPYWAILKIAIGIAEGSL